MKTDWHKLDGRGIGVRKVNLKPQTRIVFGIGARIAEQIAQRLRNFVELDINETKRRDRIFGDF
jgi:hypothetical protein